MSKKSKRVERLNQPPEVQEIAKRRSPDVPDPEKKSTGHGKETADKWNQ